MTDFGRQRRKAASSTYFVFLTFGCLLVVCLRFAFDVCCELRCFVLVAAKHKREILLSVGDTRDRDVNFLAICSSVICSSVAGFLARLASYF